MPAVALTDHGVMGGIVEFYQHCHWNEIKPIIGCEIYLSPTTRFDNQIDRVFHLVLLAKDFKGYQNLCRLVSAGHIEGFHKKPRIDKEILSEHAEGLICLSGCIKGEISLPILEGREHDAKKLLNEYLGIFGRENFYLELTDHGMPIQKKANQGLIALGKEFNVKVVATNDVHYLHKKDSQAHDLLRCIKNGTTVKDKSRYTFYGDEYYFKTADEMAEVFKEIPEAVTNSVEIADRCNVKLPIKRGMAYWPTYQLGGISSKRKLTELCFKGAEDRYGIDLADSNFSNEKKDLILRLDYELDILDRCNCNDYFLMFHDIVSFVKSENIALGPGRGSAGGSLVCYLLGITDIDPIRFNLSFERFLNPERTSLPFIELDLCMERRDEVLKYIREKYGHEKTAFIAVYPELWSRKLVTAVDKALGYSSRKANQISRLLLPYPKPGIGRSIEENLKLTKLVEEEKWAEDICNNSRKLQGIKHSLDTHAAGIIVADKKITDIAPVFKNRDGNTLIQYSADECEEMGLLCLEFLGLKTLTIIQDTVARLGSNFNLNNIPFDDYKTWKLFKEAETEHVFQFGSEGMKEFILKLSPDSIEDLIAAIAIYRPGLMQFIPEFIDRKKGKTPINYLDPRMEPILEVTHGMIIYQEQIMELCHQLAGFTRGDADMLRRAMGAKKAKELQEIFPRFMKGCKEKGIGKENTEKLWKHMLEFAGYAFNKAHSAGYAMLSYRMAYLKGHYHDDFINAINIDLKRRGIA